MKVIGLTGSFGTGKSFVALIFRRLGARVIDADSIAHALIGKGEPAYNKVVKVFGKGILRADGSIDRRKLAKIVFRDKKKLDGLNSIIHPGVLRDIRDTLKKYGNDDIIVIDAPLLVEANLAGSVDKLVVVKCSVKKQMDRCAKKFRIEKEEILKRIKRQIPIKKKILMADFVIDNNGPRARTRNQAKKVWRKIAWK